MNKDSKHEEEMTQEDYKASVTLAQRPDMQVDTKEYETLLGWLREYEEKHPDKIDPNSPTQRLVGTPDQNGDRYQYEFSSATTVCADSDLSGLVEFMDGIDERYFTVYPLMSGVPIIAEYVDGKLHRVGITERFSNDGTTTVRDVTAVARGIGNLPMALRSCDTVQVEGVTIQVEGVAAIPMSWYKLHGYEPEHGWTEYGKLTSGSAQDVNASGMAVCFDVMHGETAGESWYDNIVKMENMALPTVFSVALRAASDHEIIQHILNHNEASSLHKYKCDCFIVASDCASDPKIITVKAPKVAHALLRDIYYEQSGAHIWPYVRFDQIKLGEEMVSTAQLFSDDMDPLVTGSVLSVYMHPRTGPVARVLETSTEGTVLPRLSSCPECGGTLVYCSTCIVCENCEDTE